MAGLFGAFKRGQKRLPDLVARQDIKQGVSMLPAPTAKMTHLKEEKPSLIQPLPPFSTWTGLTNPPHCLYA